MCVCACADSSVSESLTQSLISESVAAFILDVTPRGVHYDEGLWSTLVTKKRIQDNKGLLSV